MATEEAIKKVNCNVRSIQNEKSVKLNKEKQKLIIRKLIAHHFYKMLTHIFIVLFAHNWV